MIVDMLKEAFFCSCGSNEHFFVVQRFNDQEEIYLSIYLDQPGFFRRVINAIKYVLGYKSKYGQFSEICLDQKTQLKLAYILETHIKQCKKDDITK
ncbi:MAG: hypothetical protein RI886_845 [Pseudomonadota bacterium]|jgi:hypothetical protein